LGRSLHVPTVDTLNIESLCLVQLLEELGIQLSAVQSPTRAQTSLPILVQLFTDGLVMYHLCRSTTAGPRVLLLANYKIKSLGVDFRGQGLQL
jgi:hypothetical protein